MLTLCTSTVLSAAFFLAGIAIAANADPASTGGDRRQRRERFPIARPRSRGTPPSTATPVPNSVTQLQTPAGAFGSSGARSDKGSFYSKHGFGPAPITRCHRILTRTSICIPNQRARPVPT
jgi:hypothetical protein